MDTRTLDDGWIEMPRLLMEMVQEYAAMTERQQRRVVGQLIVEKIHTVGHTAAFFGGWEAMKKLHDAAVELENADNRVGYWLNLMWDGIGGWWA